MKKLFSQLAHNWSNKRFAIALSLALAWIFVPKGLLPGGAPQAEALAFIVAIPLAWKVGVIAAAAVGAWYGGKSLVDAAVENLFEWLSSLLFKVAALFMTSMAGILELALATTLDSETLGSLQIIDVGWTLVRDASNMFFIFILLYIAIQTILGIAGHTTKTLLRNIIIVALLMNFSLFFTKVVIDATNIFALTFYWKVETVVAGNITYGPTAAIMEGFKLQSIVATKGSNPVDPAKDLKLSGAAAGMVYIGGAILLFITGYVFLAGALMMIIRSIVFIFCMIFSPFAFLGYILPKMSSVSSAWWNQLLGNALVAPVFMFMIYLDVRIIRDGDLFKLSGASDGSQIGQVLGGNLDNIHIIYNFIILIGIMIGTLIVSKSVAGGTASMATSWAKKGLGLGAGTGVAAVGIAGRQVLGRGAKRISESTKVDEWTKRKDIMGTFSRGLKEISSRAQKSTFDVRNTKAGGVLASGLALGGISAGRGGTKSYEKAGAGLGTRWLGAQNFKGTEKESAEIKRLQEVYKGNPEALEIALRSKYGGLGTGAGVAGVGGGQYEAERHKELRKQIGRDKEKSEARDVIKTEAEEQKELTKQKQEAEAAGNIAKLAEIERKMADSAKRIAESLGKLTGKEALDDTLGEDDLKLPAVQAALKREHLAYIQSNPANFPPELRKTIGAGVYKHGTPEQRQYLTNLAKLNTSMFDTDLTTELQKRVDGYKEQAKDIAAQPESPEKRTALAKLRAEHDDAVGDILGGMKVQSVAMLSVANEQLMTDETVVRNYVAKHFDAIEKYHKTILHASGEKLTPAETARLATIREHAEKAGGATAKYMSKVNKDSVYFKAQNSSKKKAEEGEEEEEEEGEEGGDRSA